MDLNAKRFRSSIKDVADPGYGLNKTSQPLRNSYKLPRVLGPKINMQEGGEVKRISAQEIQNRRNRRLCFKCGEKYGWGHQCKIK